MALGDSGNYQSNNRQRVFDPSFYSRIKIKNRDKLAVNFTFQKGMLNVSLNQEKENYRYDEIISINITPTKAKLLIHQLEKFIAGMKNGEITDPSYGVGVNSGVKDTVSFIAFKITGNKPEIPEHEFVIGKVNSNGQIEDVVSFVFNTDYDYSLVWSNVENMDVDKEIDQFMGINTFLDVLKEFAYSSSGAIGAAVWDTGRYEMNRVTKSFQPIYDKLGIEIKNNRSNNNNNSSGGGNSFFDRQTGGNNAKSTSTTKTFEDLEDMLS